MEGTMAQRFTTLIQRLLEVPDELGGGMQVLRGLPTLMNFGTYDMVIRQSTTLLWQAVIDSVGFVGGGSTFFRVCVLGSPGIGKTSTTPWLIKMLIRQNKTVVYHIRDTGHNGWLFEYVPGRQVVVYPGANLDDVASLRNQETYYIVDPGITEDSCNPSLYFQAKTIIVSSPNSQHYGGKHFARKHGNVKGVFLYIPIWMLWELLRARPYMLPAITEIEVRRRYELFGGIPRLILDDDVDFNVKNQKSAVTRLTSNQVERIVEGNIGLLDNNDESQPKSDVMGYTVEMSATGNLLFRNGIPIVASQSVQQLIYNTHAKALWNKMVNLGEGGRLFFESYTRYLLSTGEKRFICRRCVGKLNVWYRGTFLKTLGRVMPVKFTTDAIAAAILFPVVLFHSVNPTEPLIAFGFRIGTFLYLFQVTVGRTHTANRAQILALQAQAAAQSFNVRLFYQVPGNVFYGFVTDPVNPLTSRLQIAPVQGLSCLGRRPEWRSQQKTSIITRKVGTLPC